MSGAQMQTVCRLLSGSVLTKSQQQLMNKSSSSHTNITAVLSQLVQYRTAAAVHNAALVACMLNMRWHSPQQLHVAQETSNLAE